MDNDRYISLEELPYLQQLARNIYLNYMGTPYRNDNTVLQFMAEQSKINQNKPQRKLDIPKIDWINAIKQGYQPGVDLIPYRDINIDTKSLPTNIFGADGRRYDNGFSG